MEKWEGKVAVVTGASAGIGKAIAVKLAKRGIRVAALARRLDKLEELSKNFKGSGEIRGYQCDVSDDKAIKDTFNKVESEMGLIRILVNNAGVALYTPFLEFDLSKWRQTYDINVFGMFSCIKSLMETVEQKDRGLVQIINMNSVAGHTTYENDPVYVYMASKHTVTLLTECLSKQISAKKLNMKVTSISPGYVKTEVFEAGGWNKTDLDDWPSLEAEDIANAVVSVLDLPDNVMIYELGIKPKGQLL